MRQGLSAAAGPVGSLPAGLAANPCAPALQLVEAALRAEATTVALEPHRERGWLIDLDARGAAAEAR